MRTRDRMLARTTLALFAAAALWACGGSDDHHADDPNTDDQDHGHAHEPMFEGSISELGDHEANLEIVLDAEAGKLELYLLNAHATDVVRSSQESLQVTIEPDGGDAFELTLNQVGSDFGETVGDSSVYEVQDDRLKGLDHFHGRVASTLVMGTTYEDVEIVWPPGEHHHDDEEGDGEAGDGEEG